MTQQTKDLREIKEMLREIIDLLKEEKANQKLPENFEKNSSRNTIDENVTNYLYYLGLQTQYKGFGMLKQAIVLQLQFPTKYNSLTKVYAKIAEDKQVKISGVERCIRNVIERTYQKSNGKRKKIWGNMFGNSIVEKGKVTNSEFISRAVEEIGSILRQN